MTSGDIYTRPIPLGRRLNPTISPDFLAALRKVGADERIVRGLESVSVRPHTHPDFIRRSWWRRLADRH